MSTPNGPLAFQDWTCPHCAAVWHSGRQYCVDCGYGLTEGTGFTPPVSRGGGPAVSTGGRAEESGPQWTETHELQEALARSVRAESDVQAEVAVLRERTAQLQARLDEQRRVFVTGVQQMLKPVQDYFLTQHLDVPFSALIPEMLTRLESAENLAAEEGRWREGTKTVRRPVAARQPGAPPRVAADSAELTRLEGRLAAVEQLIAERLPLHAPVTTNAYDQVSQTYDTFVMSDRQSAEIERALLGAQTRTGRPYGG